MAEFVKAANAGEIGFGQARTVEIGDKHIALFNVDGSFYAIDDTCTHIGGPLSEGELDGCRVSCRWHGAIFDVTTGHVLGPPAAAAVSSYKTRVQDGKIEVEV